MSSKSSATILSPKVQELSEIRLNTSLFFMSHFENRSKDRIKVMSQFSPSLVALILFLSWSSITKAEIYEFYRGVRALGMGGADTAVVNDETALLVNPAGLGKLRDSITTVFDPEMEFSTNNYDMYKKKVPGSLVNLSDLSASLDNYREQHYHYKYQVFPSVVVKNFGIGFLLKEQLDAKMRADGLSIDTNYYYDMALATGFNFRFWDGRIKLGVTAKAVNRVEAIGNFPVAQSLKAQDVGSEGYGMGSDVGLILSAPWGWIPTLSVVGRNVGGLKFTNTGLRYKLSNKPTDIEQDADIALAFFPIHSNRARSSFTFEHKHYLTANQYTNKNQLYHFGWETNFNDMAFFRLGWNGVSYTTGFELAAERLQLQLAYYTENAGTEDTPDLDKRWVFKVSYRY